MNGGFGMVIDGTPESDRRLESMLFWDVNNGIARRSWARNRGAMSTIQRTMQAYPGLRVTLPTIADDNLVEEALGLTAREG
jgi:urocanate hydratase